MAKTLVIICAAPTGYRRGGVALAQGENRFALARFSAAQLAQLEADPRITLVADAEAADPGDPAEGPLVPERLAELLAHIQALDRDDASLWKEDGSPKAIAFPKGTTSDERAAAWDAFTQRLDGAE